MEVHPPEHAIRSWRDFLIHMATITLGLLIALGLEHVAEVWHHHEIVNEARERIREELHNNLENLQYDDRAISSPVREMDDNIQILRTVESGGKPQADLHFAWSLKGMDDAASQSAKDTGALALMPYDEVEKLSSIYQQQKFAMEDGIAYIRQMKLAAAVLRRGHTQQQLSPSEVQELIADCSAVLAKADLMQDFNKGLEEMYQAMLTAKK